MLLRSRSLLGDDPDGVDDAGEVAEEGEDEADPELDLQRQQFGPTLVDQPPRNNARTRTLAGCRWTIYAAYPAAELEEDPERRQDDGEDDVDAGRRAVRHLATCLACAAS